MTIITLNGSPLHTVGSLPPVGTMAPNFTVTKTDFGEITLKNYLGKKIILNMFPSLDTPICANAMRQFNELSSKIPDVLILCVSVDLPFAQKRFCVAEHLENVQCVSVFRHPSFGEDYGVTIIDEPLAGLLSRAVIVLDEHGKIVFSEQVKELSNEPNYSAIIKALEGISTEQERQVKT
jgi:thiol peroxidase